MGPDVYVVEWRPQAADDLIEIIRYIAKDKPERAISFGQELRVRVEQLQLFPLRGRAGKLKGLRELIVYRNYIVIYRVKPQSRYIEIMRIIHAARQGC
ncbi:type II toxin-antitoxin system RelE/ParE family toxin [Asticcacaulis sp. W401b]|uniref:type II toxin-antitoxin system RelE/ParE family toxin n=1 Tax=Asticcacaulis sp. W401b TaxID=3388666 RepID=UPI003970FA10